MRFRPHRVVQDTTDPAATQGHGSSLWANLPQELLREVLLKVEASESSWPPRKSVVACAGVCRSWRIITKEIVKVPELSAKLTFPISLKQVSTPCTQAFAYTYTRMFSGCVYCVFYVCALVYACLFAETDGCFACLQLCFVL